MASLTEKQRYGYYKRSMRYMDRAFGVIKAHQSIMSFEEWQASARIYDEIGRVIGYVSNEDIIATQTKKGISNAKEAREYVDEVMRRQGYLVKNGKKYMIHEIDTDSEESIDYDEDDIAYIIDVDEDGNKIKSKYYYLKDEGSAIEYSLVIDNMRYDIETRIEAGENRRDVLADYGY